tara:strand:+ start:1033 stop:1290 length:258 start_codon:yes stop_codon:yes gene_type:complete
MFFNFSLSNLISKKIFAKFLQVDFETLQSIYSILIYKTQHKVFVLGPLFVKKEKGFLKNFKIDIGPGTSMPRAQPVIVALAHALS